MAKLEELQALGGPVLARQAEAEARPAAAASLQAAAARYQAAAASADPQYAHIPQDERQKVRPCCGAGWGWLGFPVKVPLTKLPPRRPTPSTRASPRTSGKRCARWRGWSVFPVIVNGTFWSASLTAI